MLCTVKLITLNNTRYINTSSIIFTENLCARKMEFAQILIHTKWRIVIFFEKTNFISLFKDIL
jgi:hypothetical protein